MAKKITSVDIALHFLQTHQLAFRNGQFHLYNQIYYEPLTAQCLRNLLVFYIQHNFRPECSTAAMVTEVVATLKDRCFEQGEHQPFWKTTPDKVASVLVLENGVLDLSPMYAGESEVLLPHTDELFASTACDYAHDPQATCGEFDEFIQWMGGGDIGVVRLLLEFMAYCLLRSLDLQRFLILIGSGSNGKSVLLRVLQRLVGFANCSALSFERIGTRFDIANLADRAVNIAADTNEVSRVAEGNLKMLVDGSVLTFERKYRDPFDSINRARLIFAANLSPRWRDRTDGLWRRMLMVPCNATVSGAAVVRNLENNFNYPGILNTVLAAGRELVDRGEFAVPYAVTHATDQHRVEANPAESFLTEYTTYAPGGFVINEHLYSHYRTWCEGNGYQPLAANNFGKAFAEHYRSDLLEGTVTRGKTNTIPRRNGYENVAYCSDGIDEYFEGKEREQKRKQEREQTETARREKRDTWRENSADYQNVSYLPDEGRYEPTHQPPRESSAIAQRLPNADAQRFSVDGSN